MFGGWSLDKLVIDCGQSKCSPVPWMDPVTVIQVPFWQSSWMLVVIGILLFVTIVATAMVRYRRHERLETEHKAEQATEQAKAQRKTTACPTCGTVYFPEGKK